MAVGPPALAGLSSRLRGGWTPRLCVGRGQSPWGGLRVGAAQHRGQLRGCWGGPQAPMADGQPGLHPRNPDSLLGRLLPAGFPVGGWMQGALVPAPLAGPELGTGVGRQLGVGQCGAGCGLGVSVSSPFPR